jgi:putative sterol carrier protein
MAHEFGTSEYVQALQEAINSHEGYERAARDWEGDFCFVVDKSPGYPEAVRLYLDLWHGKCREAYRVEGDDDKDPAFVLSAPSTVWQRVLNGQLDPIRGLMSRQLKLKGNMMQIMKTPKAAIELVAAARTVPTEWPS